MLGVKFNRTWGGISHTTGENLTAWRGVSVIVLIWDGLKKEAGQLDFHFISVHDQIATINGYEVANGPMKCHIG